jgi:(1->4)-alpha-D-glucan 1-alpha-D-glucosylmutase
VDPDNRRPVDFPLRRALLAELPSLNESRAAGGDAEMPIAPPDWRHSDGRAKLHLIRQALRLRAETPRLFAAGDYLPLPVSGPLADHLIAFARRHDGRALITLAPRLLAGLLRSHETDSAESGAVDRGRAGLADPFAHAGWESTLVQVPGRRWRDRLTGGGLDAHTEDGGYRLRAADVLRRFPVGLLSSDDNDEPGRGKR